MSAALHEHEALIAFKCTAPHEMHRYTIEALQHLHRMLGLFLHLRKNRALSDLAVEQTRGIQAQSIYDALALIQRVVMPLTMDNYAERVERDTQHSKAQNLYGRLSIALLNHGPTDRSFSSTALRYAIATVFIHFALEEGDPTTVAERLRKRMATPPKRAKG